MSMALVLLSALFLAHAIVFPVSGTVNHGAAVMLAGWLKVALASCLVALRWPRAGSLLALGAVTQALLLVLVATPPLAPLNPYFGDARFVLVVLQGLAAALTGTIVWRRGGDLDLALAAALAYLCLPASWALLAQGRLWIYQLPALVAGLAMRSGNAAYPGRSPTGD